MTHKDIYEKFMIEYDKANITSSYPSLTKYEIATLLDKAYLALIAQKFTGNNRRSVQFESDLKNIEDLRPLVTTTKMLRNNSISAHSANDNRYSMPEDLLYYIKSDLSSFSTLSPTQIITHQMVDQFKVTEKNYPWIDTPVCYIQGSDIHVFTDPDKDYTDFKLAVTYIKKPKSFCDLLSPGLPNTPSDPDHGGSEQNPVITYTYSIGSQNPVIKTVSYDSTSCVVSWTGVISRYVDGVFDSSTNQQISKTITYAANSSSQPNTITGQHIWNDVVCKYEIRQSGKPEGGGSQPITYTVTVSKQGNEHGTVSIVGHSENTVTVAEGTQLTIKAVPDSGYKFQNWTETLVQHEHVETPEHTFVVNNNLAWVASFVEDGQSGGDDTPEHTFEIRGGKTEITNTESVYYLIYHTDETGGVAVVKPTYDYSERMTVSLIPRLGSELKVSFNNGTTSAAFNDVVDESGRLYITATDTCYFSLVVTYDNEQVASKNISAIISGGDDEQEEYVDLGLPSGTLWATKNVGASSPSEIGTYFSWGEAEGKSDFSLSNYTYLGDEPYNNFDKPYQRRIGGSRLDPSPDGFAMPSVSQLTELLENCTWTMQDGNVYRVTGPNGSYILIPTTGIKIGATDTIGVNTEVRLWSDEKYINDNRYYLDYFVNHRTRSGRASYLHYEEQQEDRELQRITNTDVFNGMNIRPIYIRPEDEKYIDCVYDFSNPPASGNDWEYKDEYVGKLFNYKLSDVGLSGELLYIDDEDMFPSVIKRIEFYDDVEFQNKVKEVSLDAIKDENFAGIQCIRIVLNSNIDILPATSFHGCEALKVVDFHNTDIQIFGPRSLSVNHVRYVRLPESLTTIGSDCYGCMPGNFQYVGDELLPYFNPAAIEDINSKYDSEHDYVCSLPDTVKWISAKAFQRVPLAQDVVLPSSVIHLGNGAFDNSGGEGAKEITIPGSIKKIEAQTFANTCYQEYSINEGIEEIENQAFYGIGYTEKLVFPKTIKTVHNGAFDQVFSGASLLKLIDMHECDPNINFNFINLDCNNTYRNEADLVVRTPEAQIYHKRGNIAYCITTLPSSRLDRFISDAGNEHTYDYVLNSTILCGVSKELLNNWHNKTIEDSQVSNISNIGQKDEAFNQFDGNTKFTIECEYDTGVGYYFYKDTKPASEKSISNMPNRVLAEYSDYENFDSIIDSRKTVTYNVRWPGIWYKAFYNCSRLKSVKIVGNCSFIGDFAFSNTAIETLDLTDCTGLKSIGKHAFESCNITKVELPDGVEFIDDGAFSLGTIGALILPESIQYLGNGILNENGTNGDYDEDEPWGRIIYNGTTEQCSNIKVNELSLRSASTDDYGNIGIKCTDGWYIAPSVEKTWIQYTNWDELTNNEFTRKQYNSNIDDINTYFLFANLQEFRNYKNDQSLPSYDITINTGKYETCCDLPNNTKLQKDLVTVTIVGSGLMYYKFYDIQQEAFDQNDISKSTIYQYNNFGFIKSEGLYFKITVPDDYYVSGIYTTGGGFHADILNFENYQYLNINDSWVNNLNGMYYDSHILKDGAPKLSTVYIRNGNLGDSLGDHLQCLMVTMSRRYESNQSEAPEYKEPDPEDTPLTGEFVDLGLPSGNLWYSVNEGATENNEAGQLEVYTWANVSAVKRRISNTLFNDLPSETDVQELVDNCTVERDATSDRYTITGPNGNHITMVYNIFGYITSSLWLGMSHAGVVFHPIGRAEEAHISVSSSRFDTAEPTDPKCCVRRIKKPYK